MKKNEYILSDEDIAELSEGCPMSEGGTLEDFVEEASVVAQAVKMAGVDLQQLRPSSRALFLAWSFYFLGVLRGGESYREEIYTIDELNSGDLNNEARETCAFALVDWIAQDMAEELDTPEVENRKRLVELLGMGDVDR